MPFGKAYHSEPTVGNSNSHSWRPSLLTVKDTMDTEQARMGAAVPAPRCTTYVVVYHAQLPQDLGRTAWLGHPVQCRLHATLCHMS